MYTNFDLNLSRGAIYCLVGPNGSGKTTLLNLISGALSEKLYHSSSIPCCYMLQDYSLSVLPWLTVEKNIFLPYQDSESLSTLWTRATNLVGHCHSFQHVVNLKGRLAATISGGQKQQVALFRACLSNMPLILLDEPFSSIDLRTRLSLIKELKAWVDNNNNTILCSVHTLDDALLFADFILVLPQLPISSLPIFETNLNSTNVEALATEQAINLRTNILKILEK